MIVPPANISMVTLGVADLERSTGFYDALGWRNTRHSQEAVRFLQGHDIVLGLFGRAALAEDAGIEDKPTGFSAIALALNLGDRAGVDSFYSQALNAGGRPVKPPQAVFWGGYSGYFSDPDGHLWEIAHNPFFPVSASGRLDLIKEQER